MASEDRITRRRHLIYYLEVMDVEKDELLGHLVDITETGVKLVSKNPIVADKMMRLKMKLPEEYFPSAVLEFTAQSLWCNNDVNPDFFDTGFIVHGLSDDEIKIVNELIEIVGFNDFSGDAT